MEKINSGQPYLYRESGLNSTVIDVRMKDKVRGDFLHQALIKTLQRYPYMASKLVEKNGDFYIEPNLITMTIAKTDKLRVLGSIQIGYHLIDLTYINNKICISFHHALCDGRGVKPFVETLIYYYCCMRYNKKLEATGVHLASEPLLPGETQEPVGTIRYEFDEKNLPQVDKDGYALPENSENDTNYYRYEININQNQFVEYAKKNNATPAILVALLASRSILRLHPDADKPIVCSMATDYRKELGFDNTHKNCVGSIYLPFSDETKNLPLSEQATLYRSLMKAQRSPDAIKCAINGQISLFEKLAQLPSLEEKRQMMSFFNTLCINTYVISYLGQMQLGESAKYVEAMYLYSSGTKGLRLAMISVAQSITIGIQQSFESNAFVLALLKSLDEIGIEYTASDRIQYETTKDKAFITAGRQSEKYYKKISN